MSQVKHEIPHLVQFIPDKETGGYVAQIPDLPGCLSQGETLEEAVRMIKEAYELWMESEEDKCARSSTERVSGYEPEG